MLSIMEIDGVLDIDGVKGLEIYTEYTKFASVRDEITKLGFVVKEAELIKEPKMYKEVSDEEKEKVLSGIERLEDNDDVQNVWSNLKD